MFYNEYMKSVKEINFMSRGSKEDGFLTVIENSNDFPFPINRVYTVTDTKEGNIRGYHAHKKLWQVFFALNGSIKVTCENQNGEKKIIVLDSPNKGLICGPMIWHTLEYHNSAVLMVLASEKYNENDYIREYDRFKNYENTSK